MEVSYRFDGFTIEELEDDMVPAFLVATEEGGRLQLMGELDLVGAQTLQASLAAVDGDIELDCSGLTFVDCAGLRVLQETQRRCDARGLHFCLVNPARCVIRLLDLAGLDAVFDIRGGAPS